MLMRELSVRAQSIYAAIEYWCLLVIAWHPHTLAQPGHAGFPAS